MLDTNTHTLLFTTITHTKALQIEINVTYFAKLSLQNFPSIN